MSNRLHSREEYLAKIARRVASYDIKLINEPRPNKKLLVLDVDYTLFGKSVTFYDKRQNQGMFYFCILSFVKCLNFSQIVSMFKHVMQYSARSAIKIDRVGY